MKSRIFVAALALVGLGILDAKTANAVDYYFEPAGATATWNSASWRTDGCGGAVVLAVLPANAHAVICSGKTADVNAAVANPPITLRVEEGGVVTISGFTLPLTGSAANVLSHQIEGRIELTDSNASILLFSNSAVVAGGGRIVGNGSTNSPRIQIGADDTLRLDSRTTIEGTLTMMAATGSATFINDGIVNAKDADYLVMDTLTLNRGSGGVYMVSIASGFLQFTTNATATELSSDFRVENGTLDVLANLITSGTLYKTGGTVDCSTVTCVFANAEFH